jgi:uncharacterized protein (DUF1778 family)
MASLGAKDGRIALRASREERELIARASRASDTSVSDFVLRASLARAEDVLADRREFELDAAAWAAFVEVLDRPPTVKPRLRNLMRASSVLER